MPHLGGIRGVELATSRQQFLAKGVQILGEHIANDLARARVVGFVLTTFERHLHPGCAGPLRARDRIAVAPVQKRGDCSSSMYLRLSTSLFRYSELPEAKNAPQYRSLSATE